MKQRQQRSRIVALRFQFPFRSIRNRQIVFRDTQQIFQFISDRTIVGGAGRVFNPASLFDCSQLLNQLGLANRFQFNTHRLLKKIRLVEFSDFATCAISLQTLLRHTTILWRNLDADKISMQTSGYDCRRSATHKRIKNHLSRRTRNNAINQCNREWRRMYIVQFLRKFPYITVMVRTRSQLEFRLCNQIDDLVSR